MPPPPHFNMPIRLNLLAEAQTAEELRRRDPVKRAIWICGIIVFAVLLFSGYLQWRIITSKRTLSNLESGLATQASRYQLIISNQKQLSDVHFKLDKLNEMATNRFLWGNVLNALQETTVDDIQLLRLKSDQIYELKPETKPGTNDAGKFVPGKPAMIIGKIVLTFDSKDSSPNPGATQMNKFKAGIQTNAFFKSILGKTNEIALKNYSMPQPDPELGRLCVLFSLQCALPEKVFK